MSERDDSASVAPRGADTWDRARQAMAEAVADESLVGLPAALQRICRAVTTSLSLNGAVVQVIIRTDEAVVLASSDDASRRLGELPFEVGEGPSVDAFASARPVLVPDLLGEGQSRWPGYVSVIGGDGLRAAYALPLHVGAVRLGVLELYGGRIHPLSPAELSLALVFAQAAIDSQLEPPSGSSVALLDDSEVEVMDRRVEIHQAQGMVTVDLAVDLAQALALMRAHAFGRGIPLLEISRLILAGERLYMMDGD